MLDVLAIAGLLSQGLLTLRLQRGARFALDGHIVLIAVQMRVRVRRERRFTVTTRRVVELVATVSAASARVSRVVSSSGLPKASREAGKRDLLVLR